MDPKTVSFRLEAFKIWGLSFHITVGLSRLLCTPGILLCDISSLSSFPLSLKPLLTCFVSQAVRILSESAVAILPSSSANGVINIGDPFTVIGCGPGREG